MIYLRLILLIFVSLFFSCKKKNQDIKLIPVSIPESLVKNSPLSDNERKYWHHKDIMEDTIPGISLEKAYRDLIHPEDGEEVIVAVIDSRLDINHKDIHKHIWTNDDEIPNNSKDDDDNGYVDDINGWNFLGNSYGDHIYYANYESIRIIRKYDSIFKGKSEEQIESHMKEEFLLYKKAEEQKNIELKISKGNIDYGTFLFDTYPKSKTKLKTFFPKEDYTIPQLDSLYKVYEKDSILGPLIYYMADYKKYKLTPKWIEDFKKNATYGLEKSLNISFNEREVIEPKNNKQSLNYGNNKVWSDSLSSHHAINVAGVLVSDYENNKNSKSISHKIKIMPICVSPIIGNEHDKDISLAIKYAVDNGAQIINMSFGKDISMDQNLVDRAIQYAGQKDVLIITSTGNDNKKLTPDNSNYPRDYDNTGSEVANNLINVGSISKTVDESFKSFFSNFSDEHVDIFAPGHDIYTTIYDNDYGYISGTSLASPMVAGVAALIKSYFPQLSAKQIKKIIMNTGISYNIDIEIKQKDGTKKLVPFSELSKSGKVVNAYNALLMAEQISKTKN